MHTAQVLIFGNVQGVGFRQFIKQEASLLRLSGWVQNLPDGNVEAVLQGKKEDVEKMILLCKKGPMLSKVKNVEVVWGEDVFPETGEEFEIL